MSATTTERVTQARHFWIGLAIISAVALGIRLLYIATIATRTEFLGDPQYYHVQANLLADGFGFADPYHWLETGRIRASARHPPLYPLLLSISSFFGGDSPTAHKVVSCVIGTTTVFATGLVGREVAGIRAGLVAAGIAAVYPNLWAIDGQLLSEGLAATFVAFALWFAYRLQRRKRGIDALGFGVAVALAALTRPETILMVPLLALPLVLRLAEVTWARRMQLLAIIGGALLVLIGPWFARNLTIFDAPVTFSTNGDDVFAPANCDRTYAGDLLGYWYFPCGDLDFAGDESEIARQRRAAGLEYIGDHLGRVPVVLAARVGRIWEMYRPFQNASLAGIDGRDREVALAGLWSYWLLVPFAVAGGVLLHRRRERLLYPLLVPFIVTTAVALYAYGSVRFRAPAEPALAVLAAVAVERLAGRAVNPGPAAGTLARSSDGVDQGEADISS